MCWSLDFFEEYILHNFELLSCSKYQFSAKTTKSGQLSINLCEKDSLVTCIFIPFDDKFFDEIIHAKSLIALAM